MKLQLFSFLGPDFANCSQKWDSVLNLKAQRHSCNMSAENYAFESSCHGESSKFVSGILSIWDGILQVYMTLLWRRRIVFCTVPPGSKYFLYASDLP